MPDPDGDGYVDGVAVQNGSDPLDPLSPPHAVQETITTQVDTPVTIDVLANDVGALGVTLAIGGVVQQPSHGTVVVSGTGILCTPAAHFCGTHTFTYTASDSVVAGNAAIVTVAVTIITPAAPTLVSPTGTIGTASPTYTWAAVAGAAEYNL